MYLLSALGIETVDDLDTSRPLRVGPLELGIEATVEAARILNGGDFQRDISLKSRIVSCAVYWSVAHQEAGSAEIFCLPGVLTQKLPTAIEVAFVRALAAALPDKHEQIFEGNIEIALGPEDAWKTFRPVVGIAHQPMVGTSLLFGGASGVIVHEGAEKQLSPLALQCLSNSFSTSPLKFRFLELYRVMEARFLADVRSKLFSAFDAEPGAALSDAIDSLKSEINQIVGLAQGQPDAFEACWSTLHAMKTTNRFVAAIFRRIDKKGNAAGTSKWQVGAALVYQIRCAIVHAGEKDIIFENFSDGDTALDAVIALVERATLLLVGIELT